MKFSEVVHLIGDTHANLQHVVVKAVNRHLTFRNWLKGYYIVEFEQNGEDCATYGSRLREEIADKSQIKELTAPELSRCRQFCQTYPQILGMITQELNTITPARILWMLSQELPYLFKRKQK